MSKAGTVCFSSRSMRTGSDPETRQSLQNKKSPLGSLFHPLRTHIIIPATFAPAISNHQQLWFSHALPKRVDSLIVFGFWIVSIILSCVGYDSFTGNISSVYSIIQTFLGLLPEHLLTILAGYQVSTNRIGNTLQIALEFFHTPVCRRCGCLVVETMFSFRSHTSMSSRLLCSIAISHGFALYWQ